jgi:hypothetical protein
MINRMMNKVFYEKASAANDNFYGPEVRLSLELLLRRTACAFDNSIQQSLKLATQFKHPLRQNFF